MKHGVLTVKKVATAKGPARYCDGMGLWLQVSQYGTRAWVYRYNFAGKVREMGLGSIHAVPLGLARELAREQRALLLQGEDPIEHRKAKRDRVRAQAAERITFKEAAEQFISVHAPMWRNDKHRHQWASTLTQYAYPHIGSRPITAITGALITETLAGIWLTKQVTASRTKQRIERVIEWVKNGKPLPQQRAKRVQHFQAIPFVEIPAFMAALRERAAVSARALEFLTLTASRSGEAIGAQWSEIDIDAATWTVPASRMKKGTEHIVPLSRRAIEILAVLPRVNDFLFPGVRGGQPIGEDAMLVALREIRGNGDTVHGLRSSFRDWAGDATNFPHEVVEFALAHSIPSKTAAAYRRYSALTKRRALMEQWSGYCASSGTSATVTPLRRKA